MSEKYERRSQPALINFLSAARARAQNFCTERRSRSRSPFCERRSERRSNERRSLILCSLHPTENHDKSFLCRIWICEKIKNIFPFWIYRFCPWLWNSRWLAEQIWILVLECRFRRDKAYPSELDNELPLKVNTDPTTTAAVSSPICR